MELIVFISRIVKFDTEYSSKDRSSKNISEKFFSRFQICDFFFFCQFYRVVGISRINSERNRSVIIRRPTRRLE